MDDRGTPINNCPMIGSEDIDLYRLFRAVEKLGGYNRVTNQNQWKSITRRLSFSMQNSPPTHILVKQAYKKFLHSFEDFYRKLGCTMVSHPRGSTRKQRPGRSLIRDKDRNTPIPPQVPAVKNEKEEDEKKAAEDEKKEKKEVKKEQVKEEEIVKIKKKEEPEGNGSGQESDVNVETEAESSSIAAGEKSQKPAAPISTLSSGTNTSSSRAKSKSKEETKKKTVEKKKTESKKQEKRDDKPKEEEAAKTRSKAKDDTVKNKGTAESRETRTPSREAERKTLSKQRRLTDEELKKRGRKRKEYETEKSRADEQLTETAPSYKGPVDFGDRLKVYYGPTHESKVTYEAKVIDIEKDGAEPMYLVHYTGWNTRYDEWIKASRIAQNFTQAQGRVKRTKTPRPQTPSTNLSTANKSAKGACTSTTNASQSRRRAQSVAPTSTGAGASSTSTKDSKKEEKDKETTPQPMRASTPLSIASSSSRTKSPATPANNRQTRTSRNTELSGAIEHRRRTRRMSGHTDISVVSESEGSDGYDSDTTEPEQTKTRLRGTEERKRKETRSRAEERLKTDDASDAEDEKDNLEEPRKGRRLRRTPGKSQGIKSEPDTDEEQPKGRDFDLNQIRSELKGFDKAVKMELVRMEPEPEDDVKVDEKENVAAISTRVSPKLEKLIESPKVEVVETKVDNTEDIYEFKEPEPFEFEVRNKRDTSGEKDKLKKKIFEDEPKSPKKKQKITQMSTTPAREAKTDLTDNDSRAKKPRKLFTNKRSDEAAVSEAAPVIVPQSLSKPSSQSTPSVCEDAFDKLCESPSFNQQLKPASIVEESTKAIAAGGLNLLFSDLPADDEGTRDDSEDRLIISETEVSEAEQDNSFSYQQEVQFHGAELPDTTESSNKSETTTSATVECTREETSMVVASGNKLTSNNTLPDQKQNVVKLSTTIVQSQSELRILDSKLLDIAPVAPLPIVTPPAPISARLPATSTIEEKLSAAAMAFRNKAKDNKRDNKATVDDDVATDVTTRKVIKESSKKLDITILQRMKDDEMDEQDKKREQQQQQQQQHQQQQQESAVMSEEEQRREIMRVAIRQKEEELQQLKLKKEAELKKFAEAKTVVVDHKTKLQEVTRDDGWKSTESDIGKRSEEEYKTLEQTEKDRIETRKKQVNQDILDSTDSSDSEQRLVIDNEEPQDVKMTSMSSNFDVKLRAELDRLQDTQERYARTQMPKTSQNIPHQQQQQQQECTEVKVSDMASSVSKTDEEGETMNSLLCEEEIPGSPAPPGSESIEQTNADPACNSPKNEVTESSIVLMEMPFASAPTSGQSTTCSSNSSTVATLSMSLPKTVEASMPVALPVQQNAPLNIRQQQQHQQHHQQQHQQQQQIQHHHQQYMPPALLPPQRRESNEAAPVMDNTPPTTPDSSISNITSSPREERTGGSSPTSEDNIKLNRDSSEADNDSAGKGPGFSEDDTLPNSESNSADRTLKPPAKRSICDDMQSSPKKRKRNRKHSECSSIVAPKKPPGRQSRHSARYGAASDSDDTSEGSNLCTVNTTPTVHTNHTSVIDLATTYSSRSPRPTKYNFYVELGTLSIISL